jgi:hypothetical protein
MDALTYLAPGLFMTLGGLTIGVACASTYERGLGSPVTLAAAATSVLCWSIQAFLWIQIGEAGL